MTDKNPITAYSPHNDSTNQWPFELSEYLNFDEDQWPDDDLEPLVSDHVLNANEVGDFAGSGSQVEGSSSSKPSS